MQYKSESSVTPVEIELHVADGQTQLYLRKNVGQVEKETENGTELQYTFDEAHGVIDAEIDENTVAVDFDAYYNICACWIADFDKAVEQYVAAVQQLMDAEAQKYGYDDIFAAVSYKTSSVDQFKAEAEAFEAWRDAVWVKCYAILDEIKAGGREQLPSVADVIAELPELELDA